MPLVFPVRPGLARPPGATLKPLAARAIQPPYGWPRRRAGVGVTENLFQVFTRLGLTTDLVGCLDFSDAGCYPGSGQTIADLKGTQDFFVGATGAAESDDPAHTAAGQQSYFQTDGGDKIDAQAAPAYQQTWHKDGAVFCVFLIARLPAASVGYWMATCDTPLTQVGVRYYWDASSTELRVYNGSGSAALDKIGGGAAADTIHFTAVSLSENGGANAGFFWKDGAYVQVGGADTWDPAYTAPSAANASLTLGLLHQGPSQFVANGGRLYAAAFWSGGTQITKANLDAIWNDQRGRFGL
jgi:hypothetical protein